MSYTSSVPLTRHRTSGKKRFHSEATVMIKLSDIWRATVSNENLCTSTMSIRQQRHRAFLLFKLKVMTGIVRESLCIWKRFIRRIAKMTSPSPAASITAAKSPHTNSDRPSAPRKASISCNGKYGVLYFP